MRLTKRRKPRIDLSVGSIVLDQDGRAWAVTELMETSEGDASITLRRKTRFVYARTPEATR